LTVDAANLGPCQRIRVLVENTPGVWRYIAKIVPYGKIDGGFAIVPAYSGTGGAVYKIKLKDTFSHIVSPTNPVILEKQTVTNRIKLSFHSDEATQVSGADDLGTVTSGREHATGVFKGMGILAPPFTRPVISGSVFSMTSWGLEHYPRTDIKKDTIRFSSLDLGRRGIIGRSAVKLDVYLIHRKHSVEFIKAGADLQTKSPRWNGELGIKEMMELRVCNLRSDEIYLGLSCFRRPNLKVDRNPSGYMLSSQRSLAEDTGLHVFFPAPRGAPSWKTLDRGIIRPKLVLPMGGSVD